MSVNQLKHVSYESSDSEPEIEAILSNLDFSVLRQYFRKKVSSSHKDSQVQRPPRGQEGAQNSLKRLQAPRCCQWVLRQLKLWQCNRSTARSNPTQAQSSQALWSALSNQLREGRWSQGGPVLDTRSDDERRRLRTVVALCRPPSSSRPDWSSVLLLRPSHQNQQRKSLSSETTSSVLWEVGWNGQSNSCVLKTEEALSCKSSWSSEQNLRTEWEARTSSRSVGLKFEDRRRSAPRQPSIWNSTQTQSLQRVSHHSRADPGEDEQNLLPNRTWNQTSSRSNLLEIIRINTRRWVESTEWSERRNGAPFRVLSPKVRRLVLGSGVHVLRDKAISRSALYLWNDALTSALGAQLRVILPLPLHLWTRATLKNRHQCLPLRLVGGGVRLLLASYLSQVPGLWRGNEQRWVH